MLSQHKRISEDFIDLIAKIMKKKNQNGLYSKYQRIQINTGVEKIYGRCILFYLQRECIFQFSIGIFNFKFLKIPLQGRVEAWVDRTGSCLK